MLAKICKSQSANNYVAIYCAALIRIRQYKPINCKYQCIIYM